MTHESLPRARTDPGFWVALAVAAALLFSGLGGRVLWQDEAESALLARSILRFGKPLAWDGRNLSDQGVAIDDFREGDYVHRWHPWLPLYAMAGSFRLFGISTTSARLPSALLGVFAVGLTYLLALRLYRSRTAARYAAALLATMVPFLLAMRQARWMAFASLAIAGLFLGLEEVRGGKKSGSWIVVAASVILFYSNYFIAFSAAVALIVSALTSLRDRRAFATLVKCMVISVVLCIPGIVAHRVLERGSQTGRAVIAGQFGYVLLQLIAFLVPVLVVVSAMFFLRTAESRRDAHRMAMLALALISAAAFLALGPSGVPFRYVVVFAPIAACLTAGALSLIRGVSRAAAVAILVVLVATDALQTAPFEVFGANAARVRDSGPGLGPVHMPLAGFLSEITHRVEDPEETVVAWLRAHATHSDRVVATYGDLTLQFYTGLVVQGGFQRLPLPVDPEWIVVRSTALDAAPGLDLSVRRFIAANVDLRRYAQVAVRDCMLCANSDPAYHTFGPLSDARPLLLLRRVR